ncbi:triphosphoribosyl-dephospho-CoA synthase CitG [Aerococcaceae bacterium DSM 111020]|nr:triphosphoribosyl-dephospho-CoA synthase CitG [Aerococcaceae bacterium DSM 111020]
MAKLLSQAAIKALIYEVSLTPKPGLVDRNNNGSHHDMDFYTFMDSSIALEPFFEAYAQAGYNHQGPIATLFPKLRGIGIEAERAMFRATKQVNTHKGANFSLAILLGATGYFLNHSNSQLPLTLDDVHSILNTVQEMVGEAMKQDFDTINQKAVATLTHGEKLYREQGITGVRGEAMAGYPILIDILIPFLIEHKDEPFELTNQKALVYLMSITEDSNLLHRGGYEGWKKVRRQAEYLTAFFNDDQRFVNELIAFDQELIAVNLSPGGAADMLILGLYFGILMDILNRPSLF